MSDEQYKFECMRAELLGLEKPDREKFESEFNQNENQEGEQEEEIDNLPDAEVLENKGEQMNRLTGGLDELNTLLKSTKKKLDTCKSICGKVGDMFKRTPSQIQSDSEKDECQAEEVSPLNEQDNDSKTATSNSRSITVSQELMDKKLETDKQMDKLDSLLSKSETAEMSMNAQNKKMKKMLRK